MALKYETERDALETCLTLWQYIDKHHCYKHTAYEQLGLEFDFNHCPCCQYAFERTEKKYILNCEICPLWPNQGAFACERNRANSPYLHWCESRDARPMITLIKQTLETLK